MTWLLIIMLFNGGAVTADYQSKEGCQLAQTAVNNSIYPKVGVALCVPKD